jgi:hypothetical protein
VEIVARRISSVNDIVAEIVTIAKGIEGEGSVNTDTTDVQELNESHTDQLTIERVGRISDKVELEPK